MTNGIPQSETGNTQSRGCITRSHLAILLVLAAAGLASVVILGFRSGMEQFGELMGLLGIGFCILIFVLVIATVYHSLYWRWRLKPSRLKLENAVNLYREGKHDEAKEICGKIADDPREPPLARVLACANRSSFSTEKGDEEDAKTWREKAFKIDAYRAGKVYEILDATRHKTAPHGESCGCGECTPSGDQEETS
ncbi:MAG: hypothetical protein ACYS8W_00690 [Planctomycetota bacterium]|jgi:hypothetical protein